MANYEEDYKEQCFGLGPGLGIRIQAGKTGPQKRKKMNFMFEESERPLKKFKETSMTFFDQTIFQLNFFCHNKSWYGSGSGSDPYSTTGRIQIQ